MFQREKLLFEGTTEFDRYQVVEMTYEGRRARVLFSGDREAAFSGIPLDDRHEMLFDYMRRFFELVANVRPKKLLIIGGGTYTLSTALLHALPDIMIDVIEIDPGLDSIAEAFFGLEPNPRLRIIHQDGKEYLKQTDQIYNMVIIDAFTHLQIPRSLAVPDTAKVIQQHLAKDGLVAMNLISAYYGRRAQIVEHFYQMYDQQFTQTAMYPADTEFSLWQSQNFLLVAQNGKQKLNYGLRFEKLDPPAKIHN